MVAQWFKYMFRRGKAVLLNGVATHHERGNYIETDCVHAVLSQRTREPPFTAPDVEHSAWRTTKHCIDDRLIRDESAARDPVLSYCGRPRCGVFLPRLYDARVA